MMWLPITICVAAFLLITGSSAGPSIIIIGSGPAGIAAATRLLKHNFTDLRILEAENRIGGRINSVKFGDAYVDLGAEFCHGEKGNIVYSMVKEFDILRSTDPELVTIRSDGGIVKKETEEKMINFADSLMAVDNETIEGCENLVSVGECLDHQFQRFINTIQDQKEKDILQALPDWAYSYLCSYESAFDLNDLTLMSAFKLCEGDLHLNWNGRGYKTILEVMMQKFPNKNNQLPIDDKIFLGKVVNRISGWRAEDKVKVGLVGGDEFEADHVIFTPSLGVLKATYKDLFEPDLPEEKVNAIKSIGFGAIAKILLHFPDRWWKRNSALSFLFSSVDKEILKEKNMEWLINIDGLMQAENNPNILIGWYAGKFVPIIENLTESELLEGHLHLFNTFLKPNFNFTKPDKILRTSWYRNPNFRGTYSYESVYGHKGRFDFNHKYQDKLALPLRNNQGKLMVLFAGEATHSHFFSTVHGAIESGYREADRLIEAYTVSELAR